MIPETVNLLPARYRRMVAYRKIMATWVSVVIVMVVFCAMVASWQKARLWQATAEVECLRAEGETVQQMVASNDSLRAYVQELQFATSHLDTLEPTDDLLQTLAAVAAAGSNRDVRSYPRVRHLKIDLREAKVRTTGDQPTTALARKVIETKSAELCLTLLGEDQLQLQQWMRRLEDDPRIEDVRLGRSGIDATTGGYQTEILASVLVHKEAP